VRRNAGKNIFKHELKATHTFKRKLGRVDEPKWRYKRCFSQLCRVFLSITKAIQSSLRIQACIILDAESPAGCETTFKTNSFHSQLCQVSKERFRVEGAHAWTCK
jgi:hypothetical protein